MTKILALFLLLNAQVSLAEEQACGDLECWLKKANEWAQKTKDKSQETRTAAAEGLEEACKNLIDLKLQDLLKQEGTKLEETLSLQADLAVLRTSLAFLQLQARYNGPPPKRGEKVEEGGGNAPLDPKKLQDMQNKLNSKFKSDKNLKDQGEQLTNFFKFVKENDKNHQIPESDREKFLKALQAVSKEVNPDQSDGMSPFRYQMTAEDITLMENLMRLAPPSDSATPQSQDSLLQQTFQNLVKNFGSRNFVQSDSADLRENVRHYKKDYNQAKKELHKNVKTAMEEYLKNPGHNCKNYYDALTGKNGKKAPASDDLCLSSALREILSDKETNNLKGLVDYLERIKFKVDPVKINALSADHARTMYADLKSCSITAKIINGNDCCEIKLKMYVEHLPGEDAAHAEWFIHQGTVDTIAKEGEKYRRPGPEGNNGDIPVAHADKKVHHHGDVTTSIPVCAKAEGNQLVMFGTRKKAESTPISNPMETIKASPKMRMMGDKNPEAIEAEKKYTSNARTIDISKQCKEAQPQKPCYEKLGTALVVTLVAKEENPPKATTKDVTPVLTIKKGDETPEISKVVDLPKKLSWFCGGIKQVSPNNNDLSTDIFNKGPGTAIPAECSKEWKNNDPTTFPRLSIDYYVEASVSIIEAIRKQHNIKSVYKSEKILIPKLEAAPCTLALVIKSEDQGDKTQLTAQGAKNCGQQSTPALAEEISWKLNCPKEQPPISNQDLETGLSITIPKKKTDCTAEATYKPKDWTGEGAKATGQIPALEEKKPEEKKEDEPKTPEEKDPDPVTPSAQTPPKKQGPQSPPPMQYPPAVIPPQMQPAGAPIHFQGTR